MQYQRCGYKDSNIKEIPVRMINGQSYLFLKDVQDWFPGVCSFTYNKHPIPFEIDEHNIRLEPQRIKAVIGKSIYCHKPRGAIATGIHDNFSQQLSQIGRGTQLILENTETIITDIRILKDKADAILRQTFELAEFTTPRLFIALPEDTPRYKPAHWFHLKYRLHFLCECENGQKPHFAFHEGYEIKQPRKFLRIYGPYLRKMLTVVRYGIFAGSLIVPQLAFISSEISNSPILKDKMFWDNLNVRLERLDKILTEVQKSNSICTEENFQSVEGAELREIESFLKTTDEHRKFGNLYRSVTNDGHVQWVCIQHYEKHYQEKVIKSLHDEFRKLGGEIKGDEAIIQETASKKLPAILDVLKKGLPVFSIVLKDLDIEKGHLNKLISDIVKQSVIHNLELENITVLQCVCCHMGKKDIISKLDDIKRDNDRLNIQYSFTKSLNRFTKELIDAIKKTSIRIVCSVQSQKNKSSFELAGTNKTGFTLSINNGNNKEDRDYNTAIKDVLSMIPNITKIHLHNEVISESTWTCFRQFLTTSETLQNLTIDCRFTIKQTEELSLSLRDNRTLTILHLLNVWERENELDGCGEIFNMLHANTNLVEFDLTCQTDYLQLDFVARCLSKNKSLRILRLPKCQIYRNTDVEHIESFFQNTSIHTLSLELISTNCRASLERLARALDKNETLEILELKGSDFSAIFHRKKQTPDTENNVVGSYPVQISESSSRSKWEKFLGLFSCHRVRNRRHSHEEIVLQSVVPIQRDSSKSVSTEPFYAFCSYPYFYKYIQETTHNLKLEVLELTIGTDVNMVDLAFSMKSNLTVTKLRISKRILTVYDIQILIDALRNNTTITHLNLNDINISIYDFCKIFDVLSDDRTLHVLEVSHCITHSNRDLFTQEVKRLESKNPFLKVVYENQ